MSHVMNPLQGDIKTVPSFELSKVPGQAHQTRVGGEVNLVNINVVETQCSMLRPNDSGMVRLKHHKLLASTDDTVEVFVGI